MRAGARTLRSSSIAILSLAVAAISSAQGGLQAQVITTGLNQPLAYIFDPSSVGVGYAVQQGGVIRTVTSGSLGTSLLTIPSSDLLANGEQGLLGFALAPDWSSSGKAYAYFTKPDGTNQVAEFTRGAGGALDYSTRRDIISFTKRLGNHNGGTIKFGPDGMLYIGTGDSGGSFDPDRVAQNLSSPLGKMLRIDVTRDDFGGDATKNYGIPANNPFVGMAGADPAIWSLGLRNPFKWSFDSLNGSLLIADVGQGVREEINYIPSGGGSAAGPGGLNLGWVPFEGTTSTGQGTIATGTTVVDPIFETLHSEGAVSITGGGIVRGDILGTDNNGRYFFGDFGTGAFQSILITIGPNGQAVASDPITYNLGNFGNISSIDFDGDGTIIVTDYSGRLIRVSSPVPEPTTFAALGLGALALLRRRRRASK